MTRISIESDIESAKRMIEYCKREVDNLGHPLCAHLLDIALESLNDQQSTVAFDESGQLRVN